MNNDAFKLAREADRQETLEALRRRVILTSQTATKMSVLYRPQEPEYRAAMTALRDARETLGLALGLTGYKRRS